MNLIPRNFFFDDDFDDVFKPTRRNEMKCDIYEEGGNYNIIMDLPGYKKEDINIEVKDGYLNIKASKSNEENDENKKYIRRERVYSEVSRSFALGDSDTENISAKFENASLHITIPKIEETESKKTIEIK